MPIKEKLLGSLLSILIICLSSCSSPPKLEHCKVGSNSLLCVDERKDPEEQEYDKSFKEAAEEDYNCRSQKDELELMEWCEAKGKFWR